MILFQWLLNGRDGNKTVKEIKKRSLVSKSGAFSDFLLELKEELEPMAEHLFNKDWQNNQQKKLLESLKTNEVLGVFDFAENFKCTYQREVQSAYYAHDSATVHPIVLNYSCPHCQRIVTESCVMISNDLNHDYNLVHKFQEVVSDHLQRTRGLHIDQFYRYSDGCASQYKSKGPISDISYAKDDFGYDIIHNYSGTRHGKGASDGESGVVKRSATDAVMCGEAIMNTPKALYDFLHKTVTKEPTDTCCLTFQRTFFFVPFDSVKRNRPDRVVKTIPGTRKLHSIRNTVSNGVIAVRKISCFCNFCRNSNLSNLSKLCENNVYVENWKEIHLEEKCNPNDSIENEDLLTNNDTFADKPTCSDGNSSFSLENLHAGQFVIVSLPFGKSNREYIAQITELLVMNGVTEYHLSYMDQLQDGMYQWPSNPDSSVESFNSIRRVISPPQLMVKRSTSRIQYFTFDGE